MFTWLFGRSKFIDIFDSDQQLRCIRRSEIASINRTNAGGVWLTLRNGEDIWVDDSITWGKLYEEVIG